MSIILINICDPNRFALSRYDSSIHYLEIIIIRDWTAPLPTLVTITNISDTEAAGTHETPRAPR